MAPVRGWCFGVSHRCVCRYHVVGMFAARATTPELMDDPGVDVAELTHTLRRLEFLNRITGAYRPTLDALGRMLKQRPDDARTLRVVDIGSGYGDLLRRVCRWAAARNIAVEGVGVDLSPVATRAATAATPSSMPIRYVTADVLQFSPDFPVHIVMSSLFAHHLSDEELRKVIGWMSAQALIGWHINDLQRHPVSYWLLKMLLPVFGFPRLMRHDGPVSVLRGFSEDDWSSLISGAGVDAGAAEIRTYFPFRWGVLWTRP